MLVIGSIFGLCCTKFCCSFSYCQHTASLNNRAMAGITPDYHYYDLRLHFDLRNSFGVLRFEQIVYCVVLTALAYTRIFL